jgi:Na+-transporting NADH:ubiquinone oxidoreductase subunit A
MKAATGQPVGDLAAGPRLDVGSGRALAGRAIKLRGGYNVLLAGRPSAQVEVLPEPEVLYLPLRSRRFRFTERCVKEGQRVRPGQPLAKDPGNYWVPLLAPRAGTARLQAVDNHIVLEDITGEDEEPYDPREAAPHVPKGMGSVGMTRYKLLALGAWQFLYDAHTLSLPDPFGPVRAVLVSTLHLEPFAARGDVQLQKRLTSFTGGLKHLQSLLEYQPIYLLLPKTESQFARQVRQAIRGCAWVEPIQVPLKYPFDDFTLLARALGLKPEPDSSVWAIATEGVLAIDRALTLMRPCTVRIVAVGGPAVRSPLHLKAMPGYPLQSILSGRVREGPVRVIRGGVLTGETVEGETLGLDAETAGLTVLPQPTEREFLSFGRPGWDRRSFSGCFLSLLRRARPERFTTTLRGELRPCVSCGFCEQVCPAGIMPHLIHKLLYQDELEEADRARVDLCMGCGLCSFVCPSKIELRGEFLDAQETIRCELHAEAEEVQA